VPDIADSIAVSGLTLSHCEPNYLSDWHQAPRRQFVFIPQRGFEITTGHGETRQFEARRNVSGRGHDRRWPSDPHDWHGRCLFATAACADMELPESTQP
jgi:hypothetical protein